MKFFLQVILLKLPEMSFIPVYQFILGSLGVHQEEKVISGKIFSSCKL